MAGSWGLLYILVVFTTVPLFKHIWFSFVAAEKIIYPTRPCGLHMKLGQGVKYLQYPRDVSVKSSDLEPELGSGLTVQMTSKLHARQMVRSISRRATRALHHATLQHAPPDQQPMHDHDHEPNHGNPETQ